MRLLEFRISDLRNLAALTLAPAAGLNVFVGPNGAGKTSLLEGIYLLSHAQSFRAGSNDVLLRRGAVELVVQAKLERRNRTIGLGLRRSLSTWTARVDASDVPSLGRLLQECAVICFEPGSHALISGTGEGRRSFLDWGVFHVEHDHFDRMRRYRRVLRQRNALLKQGASNSELDAWDEELIRAAAPVFEARAGYFPLFVEHLKFTLAEFLTELGPASVSLKSGVAEHMSYAEALRQVRDRDRALGHTTRGPHRADWSLSFEQAPSREFLSRGQEKLCALACVLAQGATFAAAAGEWPIVLLDDLASELDAEHQRLTVETLERCGAQVLITGVELPSALRTSRVATRVFHVEHGSVRSLL
ncbi:MAG TPA: DNA replication/repair protein RecF [Rudaea sp.]|nr:DNA replication/repair protein RecF [Rudaea sp.]